MRVRAKNNTLNSNIDVEYDTLLNFQMNMFDFENFPKSFNPYFFLRYAIESGFSCIAKIENEWISATAELCGMPDVNGLGTDCIVTTRNGHSKVFENWRNNENLVVFNISKTYAPDLNLKAYSEMWCESRKSINAILKLARYNKIISSPNPTTLNNVEKAIENIENGTLATVLSEENNPFVENPIMNIHDITDVRNNDMIQYLSHFEDDILRKYLTMYGIETIGTSKQAQQNNAEILGAVKYSKIIMNMRKQLLDEFCNTCNERYKWDCSVEFNELWKQSLRFENVSHETLNEEINENGGK